MFCVLIGQSTCTGLKVGWVGAEANTALASDVSWSFARACQFLCDYIITSFCINYFIKEALYSSLAFFTLRNCYLVNTEWWRETQKSVAIILSVISSQSSSVKWHLEYLCGITVCTDCGGETCYVIYLIPRGCLLTAEWLISTKN